jgi:hypothetical protein
MYMALCISITEKYNKLRVRRSGPEILTKKKVSSALALFISLERRSSSRVQASFAKDEMQVPVDANESLLEGLQQKLHNVE